MSPVTLTLWGSAMVRAYRIPRHRRRHATLDSAIETYRDLCRKMEMQGIPVAAHPAIVYGPGLGPDGKRLHQEG